ncbi:hypothetical protein [Fimbriiglobus ruber]|uniref:Glycosyltransferase 2-like domain-containing protein n=1 Tax=Fimbriiglobus ruber TaxID=1908690 RepID=A0A225DWL1_9BACT|nr:hypothetical protein [Fimbriiglobus ruber]OWK45741.1 hypothetical protein FRUB_02072 [Fimbriiglobus ruber]
MLREPIHAVTVCVGYGDFLAAAAPHNAPLFDRWTVVTAADDAETREVCRQHRLHCLVTADHERDGAFSKGRAVERGLQHLPASGWILHVDADVVLPARTHDILARSHLDPAKIYGADRFLVRTHADWLRLLATGWPGHTFSDHPHAIAPPTGFAVGARWAGSDGYVPIGYFQLWHRTGGGEERHGCRTKPYPSGHGSACREDVQFALQWDRRDRQLVPELFVAHLESEPARRGANWKGRTTARFGPTSGSRPLASARRGPS